MEKLKRIIEELRVRSRPVTEQEILNTIREYLQVLILKLIYQSKYGAALSFMGGTALRICYDLKRYSEDLDFALDGKKSAYDFSSLMVLLQRELGLLGFEVSSNVHEDKIVQKSFLSFGGFHEELGLKNFRKSQKIHVKLEVDIRPVSLKKGERESFFVNRLQELYPILKHTLPTLFAGKVLAILNRPYDRGRDYYDLIWYLSRKTELNLDYLNRAMKKKEFQNLEDVYAALRGQIQKARPEFILKDIGRFLEDPKEVSWISRYGELFEQLVKNKNHS